MNEAANEATDDASQRLARHRRKSAREWVDLVDEEDRVIGFARRRRVRALNLLHRGVGILCLDATGRIYVHRRTSTKDVFPSLFDMLVGGVVGRGEDYADSARREIAEELGIVGPTPERIGEFLYLGPRNRAHVALFRVTWSGEIRHQPEEIDWGAWMTRAELDETLAREEFVPDGLAIWAHLVARSIV